AEPKPVAIPVRVRPETNAVTILNNRDYLTDHVAPCGNCHTPKRDTGQPDPTRMLQGTTLPDRPKEETPNWADQSPDIARSGLAGTWDEGAMVKFLMTGVDPDGKRARAPMPAFRLNKDDAVAVTQYLRSLPGKKR